MEIRITSADSGKSIKQFLREDLCLSSAFVKKLKFTEGGILVNGEFRTVRYELREGDLLLLSIEDKKDDVSPYIIPVNLPIDVLFDDEYLTVINKPPHMPAHPSLGHRLDTVANALAYIYKDKPYVFRPVNRLDGDTSGAMITANNRVSSYCLNSSMTKGMIHKTYLAVLDGVLPKLEGRIVGFIRRVDDSIIKREMCDCNSGGKISITNFKVIAQNGGRSLVLAYPVTGRTHQIRVHFSHLGTPIVGDFLYGMDSDIIDRQALHSLSVSFPHPSDGETMTVCAPVPEDLRRLIEYYFPGVCVEEIGK